MTCGPPTADPCRRRGWEGNSALGRDTIGTRHSNRGGPAQGGVMMLWVRAAGPHQKVRGPRGSLLGLLSCESISRRATCLRLLRSPGTPCRRRTWPLASAGVGAGVVGWANAKRAITSPAGDLQPQPQCSSWPPLGVSSGLLLGVRLLGSFGRLGLVENVNLFQGYPEQPSCHGRCRQAGRWSAWSGQGNANARAWDGRNGSWGPGGQAVVCR